MRSLAFTVLPPSKHHTARRLTAFLEERDCRTGSTGCGLRPIRTVHQQDVGASAHDSRPRPRRSPSVPRRTGKCPTGVRPLLRSMNGDGRRSWRATRFVVCRGPRGFAGRPAVESP
jgi:hypothetical protein